MFFKDREEKPESTRDSRAVQHDPNRPDVYKNQSSVWNVRLSVGFKQTTLDQRVRTRSGPAAVPPARTGDRSDASTHSSVTEYLRSVTRRRWGKANSDRTDERAVLQARGPCSTLCDVMCYLHYLCRPAAHSTSAVNTLSQKHTRDEFLPNRRHFSTPADLMELIDRLAPFMDQNQEGRASCFPAIRFFPHLEFYYEFLISASSFLCERLSFPHMRNAVSVSSIQRPRLRRQDVCKRSAPSRAGEGELTGGLLPTDGLDLLCTVRFGLVRFRKTCN